MLDKAMISLNANELGRLQTEQFRHDQRNHTDIICLSKSDRLKHYSLHYAKYVGRLARKNEIKSPTRTLTDAAIIFLCAANALHQNLKEIDVPSEFQEGDESVFALADAAGRFADACEKIDHLEDFLTIAHAANLDILRWILAFAQANQANLLGLIPDRRKELAKRQFYILD